MEPRIQHSRDSAVYFARRRNFFSEEKTFERDGKTFFRRVGSITNCRASEWHDSEPAWKDVVLAAKIWENIIHKNFLSSAQWKARTRGGRQSWVFRSRGLEGESVIGGFYNSRKVGFRRKEEARIPRGRTVRERKQRKTIIHREREKRKLLTSRT